MTTCGLSRLLVPAFLVGLAVASVTGTDVTGWLAAAATVAVLVAARAIRGGSGTCDLAPGDRSEEHEPVRGADRPADVSTR